MQTIAAGVWAKSELELATSQVVKLLAEMEDEEFQNRLSKTLQYIEEQKIGRVNERAAKKQQKKDDKIEQNRIRERVRNEKKRKRNTVIATKMSLRRAKAIRGLSARL